MTFWLVFGVRFGVYHSLDCMVLSDTVIIFASCTNTNCFQNIPFHFSTRNILLHVPRRYHDISKILTCCVEPHQDLEHMLWYVTCNRPLGGAHTCLRDVAPHALPHHPSKPLSLILHSVIQVHVPHLLNYVKENRSRLYKLRSVFPQASTRSETLPAAQFCCDPRTHFPHSPTTSA